MICVKHAGVKHNPSVANSLILFVSATVFYLQSTILYKQYYNAVVITLLYLHNHSY